jgi:release factor glutamine methyltransferase
MRVSPSAESVAALREWVEQGLLGAVAEPKREALELLAALNDAPRHWALVHAADVPLPVFVDRVREAVDRRLAGAPMQYAVRRASFRHLHLVVDQRVLIPRPETEELVALALARVPRGSLAIDVGTGSGAIALSIATEGAFTRVIGTDLSADAVAVAEQNARAVLQPMHARVAFAVGSLLDPVADEHADLIVSNPPYIAHQEAAALDAGVRDWEPSLALFGGDDGMSVLRPLVAQAAHVLRPAGWLCLETDARRAAATAALCLPALWTDVAVHLDAFGRERFVTARRVSGDA